MPSFCQSSELGELGKALASAQGEMGAAKKDATNPHFKSKYADFAAIVDASRPVLAKHGLAIVQSTPTDGATITVATRLIHGGSGEWIESSLTMTARDATPQSIGSALTYGRRYGWSTLIGLAADEDDDGEKAQPRPAQRLQEALPTIVNNIITPAAAPDGFDAWLAILEATAKDGTEALRKAWSLSALAFRSHLQNTQRTKVDELKAIAAQHDVLVPELPAEKAGKK